MTDKRNFLQTIHDTSRNWQGREWSPEAAEHDWPVYDADTRAAVLDDFDREMAQYDTADLRGYSQLCALRRRLYDKHHTLRKAGR